MPPTPAESAETANTALRELAEATRRVDDPDQLYVVIGDILGGVRALETTLDQLATGFAAHQDRAISLSGDVEAGRTATADVQEALRQAAGKLLGVEDSLDAASAHTRTLDWDPASAAPPPPVLPEAVEFDPADAHRGLSERGAWRTVTLQEERTADKTARLLEEHGIDAAIAYLAQADHGDPDIMRELEYGYAHEPLAHGHERTFLSGYYSLSLNTETRWAGLSHWTEPGSGPTHVPPLPPALSPTAEGEPAGHEQWLTVTVQTGAHADRVGHILNELGAVDAIDYLAQFDRGDDSTHNALHGGYVFDTPPSTPQDHVLRSGDYTAVLNPHQHQVTLLRRYHPDAPATETTTPGRAHGPKLIAAYSSPGAPPLREAPRTSSPPKNRSDGSWFDHPGTTPSQQSRGLNR